jgi:hypothetical protein
MKYRRLAMFVIIDGVRYVPEVVFPQDSAYYENILSSPMAVCGDFDDISIRGYLHKLLNELWEKQDGFRGKKPFGNSGWNLDLIYSLIACGYIPGVYSEEWDGSRIDDPREADRLVKELIQYIFTAT